MNKNHLQKKTHLIISLYLLAYVSDAHFFIQYVYTYTILGFKNMLIRNEKEGKHEGRNFGRRIGDKN